MSEQGHSSCSPQTTKTWHCKSLIPTGFSQLEWRRSLRVKSRDIYHSIELNAAYSYIFEKPEHQQERELHLTMIVNMILPFKARQHFMNRQHLWRIYVSHEGDSDSDVISMALPFPRVTLQSWKVPLIHVWPTHQSAMLEVCWLLFVTPWNCMPL